MRLRNIPGSKEIIGSSRYVVQEPQKFKGRWQEKFLRTAPLHIEVGMGKGRFIMDMARLHPEINYVGIEMYDSVLLRAVQKMDQTEEDLPNLCFPQSGRQRASGHFRAGRGGSDLSEFFGSLAQRPSCQTPSDFPAVSGTV